MNFSNCPEHVKAAVLKLPADNTFQKIFAEDKELDKLQELKYNPHDEYMAYIAFSSGEFCINQYTFKLFNLVQWSFLYFIGSPYVTGKKQIHEFDTDIALYILKNGVNSFEDLDQLFKDSQNFCQSLGLTYENVQQSLLQAIYICLKPLNMLPVRSSGKEDFSEQARFDVEWMVNLISCVCSVTNFTADYVKNSMNICQVYYYFAQYLKLQGAENIGVRPDKEIIEQMDNRTIDIILDYLCQIEVIKQEEKEELKTLIQNK